MEVKQQKFALTSFGKERQFETSHRIDKNIKALFEDLLSPRNILHWDEVIIEHFLAQAGRLVFESITLPEPEASDTLIAAPVSEKFKNIKEKIIVCVYSHSDMPIGGMDKIVQCILAAVPADIEIMHGWIPDKNQAEKNIDIKLLAVCSE